MQGCYLLSMVPISITGCAPFALSPQQPHAPSQRGHCSQAPCMGTPVTPFSRGWPPRSAPQGAGVTVPWTSYGTYTGHGQGVGIARVCLCTAFPDSSKAQSLRRSLQGKCGGAEIFSTSHFSVLSEGQGCIFSKAEKRISIVILSRVTDKAENSKTM